MSISDWLSYSLQDFVMFGPEVFLRLFIRVNQDFWPWTLTAAFAGVAVAVLFLVPRLWARHIALLLLALAWGCSGYVFLVEYFAPLNWPAGWFGWLFVAQGVLIGVIAVSGADKPALRPEWVLSTCLLLAVVGLPFLSVLQTGQWQSAAIFGLAPGTTAAAGALTVGVLQGPWRWFYLVVPALWSLFSAALFWVLQTWWLLLFPALTMILAGLGLWLSPRQARNPG